jgi:hypothetical protein
MDRRESLKLIALTTVSSTLLLDACKQEDKKTNVPKQKSSEITIDRMKEEKEHYEKIIATTFFTPEEMATIGILADIIIPKDAVSGSATDAEVPGFIEFIVKDKPELQTPMRGGLHWLDMQMIRSYGKPFRECTPQQQLVLVDQIAYPERKTSAPMKQGVHFFSLMRNLTASGFYTSKIGIADIGYAGNTATQWNGVPDEVLKQYNLAYTDKELKECISF